MKVRLSRGIHGYQRRGLGCLCVNRASTRALDLLAASLRGVKSKQMWVFRQASEIGNGACSLGSRSGTQNREVVWLE